MSTFPNKVSVKSAIKERNNFPLNCHHQTTSDFGLTQVTHILPLVPTDKVNLSISSFAYLASLISPTMGSCDLVQRAFFVPFDFVCADWKNLIAGRSNNQDSSTIPTLPCFSIEIFDLLFHDIFGPTYQAEYHIGALNSNDINKWITKASDMRTSDVAANILNFDLFDFYFTFHNNSTPPSFFDYMHDEAWSISETVSYDVYFRFKPLGKIFYNLLIQLGYSVELGNLFSTPADNMNLLALLSLVKVYVDYYVDPRYNWIDFSKFFREFTSDVNGFYSLDVLDQYRLIYDMLLLCSYSWFDNDLFTSSWQSHESPALNGMFKSVNISIEGAGASTSVIKNSSSAVDTRLQQPSYIQSITEQMLTMLNAVSSYFKRNSIAGTRPIDILFARFGQHMPEIVSQRSQYLGSHRVPIDISSVLAQGAGTDGDGNTSVLGERAGRGTIQGKPFNIRFENKYFYGYLMVISHIIPKTMYYQGVKPWNLNISAFDFFTPEMEEIGAEPIANAVLYSDQQVSSDSFEFIRTGIFGYGPRYYQYKFGFDTLSGDFRLKRYRNSLRSYQMFRELTDYENPDSNDLKNNSSFRQFSDKSRASYDKMFVSQDIQDDHFIINYVIECNANRPMKGIGSSLLGKIEGGKQSVGLRPNGKYF